MIKHMQHHEESMETVLSSDKDEDWNELIEYHKTQLGFVQHERLIHLIITIGIAVILSSLFIALMVSFDNGLIIIVLMLIVLEVFYIFHYYKLENGIQRWYEIYNRLVLRSHKN